jgi:hypothetical protein
MEKNEVPSNGDQCPESQPCQKSVARERMEVLPNIRCICVTNHSPKVYALMFGNDVYQRKL